MRWLKKKEVERYAGWFNRIETQLNVHLKKWARALQAGTDRLPRKMQIALFIVFVIGVSIVCSLIIYHALK
jgi:hypothetical protein